jgi:hypothetical protein
VVASAVEINLTVLELKQGRGGGATLIRWGK